jgi:predicted CopG family antitoxin
VAVKTITIDIEAYEKLASLKKEGESFSRLIKRVLSTKRSTAADLLNSLPRFALSGETLDRVDEVVRERDLHHPEAIPFDED